MAGLGRNFKLGDGANSRAVIPTANESTPLFVLCLLRLHAVSFFSENLMPARSLQTCGDVSMGVKPWVAEKSNEINSRNKNGSKDGASWSNLLIEDTVSKEERNDEQLTPTPQTTDDPLADNKAVLTDDHLADNKAVLTNEASKQIPTYQSVDPVPTMTVAKPVSIKKPDRRSVPSLVFETKIEDKSRRSSETALKTSTDTVVSKPLSFSSPKLFRKSFLPLPKFHTPMGRAELQPLPVSTSRIPIPAKRIPRKVPGKFLR